MSLKSSKSGNASNGKYLTLR